ncbi:hypothetical protein Tco_0777327 [Tanacetum coccineum]
MITEVGPDIIPLEQVWGNPTCQFKQEKACTKIPEMCMFALTVSIVETKNIKEAMADSAWIKAMQDELHQFDRTKKLGLVEKTICKMDYKALKWLWKNMKDGRSTVVRNKALNL